MMLKRSGLSSAMPYKVISVANMRRLMLLSIKQTVVRARSKQDSALGLGACQAQTKSIQDITDTHEKVSQPPLNTHRGAAINAQ